jgi:hypothetical protein
MVCVPVQRDVRALGAWVKASWAGGRGRSGARAKSWRRLPSSMRELGRGGLGRRGDCAGAAAVGEGRSWARTLHTGRC